MWTVTFDSRDTEVPDKDVFIMGEMGTAEVPGLTKQ